MGRVETYPKVTAATVSKPRLLATTSSVVKAASETDIRPKLLAKFLATTTSTPDKAADKESAMAAENDGSVTSTAPEIAPYGGPAPKAGGKSPKNT